MKGQLLLQSQGGFRAEAAACLGGHRNKPQFRASGFKQPRVTRNPVVPLPVDLSYLRG